MKKVQINAIKVSVFDAFSNGLENCIKKRIREILKTNEFKYLSIKKKSIDARKKSKVNYEIIALVTVDDAFDLSNYKNIIEVAPNKEKEIVLGTIKRENEIVIVGAGPCGLFAGLLLSKHGYNPTIIERGDKIEIRNEKVKEFWEKGILDTESNVQFGEGGAGTFSDGKLVTRIKDKRIKYVLETFNKYGADENILYEAKPHIGTEKLKEIVINIREEIIKNGGKILFNSKLTDITINNNVISKIRVNDDYDIKCDALLLAIGHSARDTYEILLEKNIKLEQKPFSMGVRIEHLRKAINFAQYGKQYKYIPENAEYFLNVKYKDRTAYSFCMCPGGVVVNAASEENMIVTNGMSFSNRSANNSNSAWVVNVTTSDFSSDHPLAGIELQRDLEKKAFKLGGSDYSVPIQRLDDFIGDKITTKLGQVKPSIVGKYKFSNLNDILPDFIKETLKNTVYLFNNKLNGFSNGDAIITGCETRTSSPVRILRDENFNSIDIKGIYPGGEGAGYAGGITSAAIDGLKLAEKIIETYSLEKK